MSYCGWKSKADKAVSRLMSPSRWLVFERDNLGMLKIFQHQQIFTLRLVWYMVLTPKLTVMWRLRWNRLLKRGVSFLACSHAQSVEFCLRRLASRNEIPCFKCGYSRSCAPGSWPWLCLLPMLSVRSSLLTHLLYLPTLAVVTVAYPSITCDLGSCHGLTVLKF